MAKTAKKEIPAGQVKYSDPRMAYTSTKSNMVLKECNELKMKDIFGENIVEKNSPIVICEDHKGLYLTSKNNVGINYLDPYRNYHRNEYEIEKNENNGFVIKQGEKTFTV